MSGFRFTDPAEAGKLIGCPGMREAEPVTVPNPELAPFVPEYDIPEAEAGQ